MSGILEAMHENIWILGAAGVVGGLVFMALLAAFVWLVTEILFRLF